MRHENLADWLGWLEQLHPKEIDLGLERVAAVWQRLAPPAWPFPVISVAGTNGKGSCVAMLEAVLRAAGYRVGVYTSPHLLRYNERVRLNGAEVEDRALCDAFARVDQARGEHSLTYFEFGTLAALDIFCRTPLDVVILEVGMGGRLDAVNIVDADIGLVTGVALDHTQWLGPDRETIAVEKAGIFRTGRPAVFGEPEVPASLAAHADRLGAALYRLGVDYHYRREGQGWRWQGPERARAALPLPGLKGAFQLQNAAAVLMVLDLLAARLPVTQNDVRRGLAAVRLAGRFQARFGRVPQLLDVAHNGQAARALADTLAAQPCPGHTRAVVGMLQDKDLDEVLTALLGQVDVWYLAGLEVPRGASAQKLAASLARVAPGATVRLAPTVVEALRAAAEEAQETDRIVVFGSFYTVAAALSEPV